jgi:hypothetical protein
MKSGIVEPENKAVARQRLRKHVSPATHKQATIGELLEAVFSLRSVPRLYNWGESKKASQS